MRLRKERLSFSLLARCLIARLSHEATTGAKLEGNGNPAVRIPGIDSLFSSPAWGGRRIEGSLVSADSLRQKTDQKSGGLKL